MHSFFILGLLAGQDAHAENITCLQGIGVAQYNPTQDTPPSQPAIKSLGTVLNYLCPEALPFGCGYFTLRQNPLAPNIFSERVEEKRSKIIYAQDFLNTVTAQYGDNASLGIFAHHVGHHLDTIANTPTWMDHSLNAELRADTWAGCALAKSQLPKEAVEKNIQVLADYPSPMHPGWGKRVEALTTGYVGCGGSFETLTVEHIDVTKRCGERSNAAYEGCIKNVPNVFQECLDVHQAQCMSNCQRTGIYAQEHCEFFTCSSENPELLTTWKTACVPVENKEKEWCSEVKKKVFLECQ